MREESFADKKRMKSLPKCLLLLWMAPHTIHGFMFDMFQPDPLIKPDLLQTVEKQQTKQLKLQILIGGEDGAQMAISDMVIELHHESADYAHSSLPGADGKHKKLSSGHRRLDVVSQGHYIDLMGTQHVKTEKECWEMCWRKDKPAGTLICGFELPETYSRNTAALPKGEVYFSFPLWTNEGVQVARKEKEVIELQLERFLEERDEALRLFDETNNPLMKAVHISHAFAATDKYNSIDHQTLETIPLDHQVIPIQEDLLLGMKGMVWANTDAGHRLLGYATVSSESNTSSRRLMP